MSEKKFITAKELANRWKMNPRTLANQRLQKKGAPYYKINERVLYDLKDIEALEKEGYVTPKNEDFRKT